MLSASRAGTSRYHGNPEATYREGASLCTHSVEGPRPVTGTEKGQSAGMRQQLEPAPPRKSFVFKYRGRDSNPHERKPTGFGVCCA